MISGGRGLDFLDTKSSLSMFAIAEYATTKLKNSPIFYFWRVLTKSPNLLHANISTFTVCQSDIIITSKNRSDLFFFSWMKTNPHVMFVGE